VAGGALEFGTPYSSGLAQERAFRTIVSIAKLHSGQKVL